MSGTGRILAVIPCLNEEEFLPGLMDNLLSSTKGLPIRFIIADGGSSDLTPAIARSLAAKNSNVAFLPNPKRYQSAGVNLAVEMHGQDAEFLIRIDAHADYPPDYCRVLVEEAQRTGADSVVTAMKTAGKNPFQRAAAAAQNSRLGNGGAAHRAAAAGAWVDHGHHALIRIKPFRAVGGYDETFSHNEDAEFDARFQKAGFKIWLTGKTFLTYYPRATPAALFRQYMAHGQGRARTIAKHHVLPKMRQVAPAAVLPACLISAATPWFWPAVLPAAVWAKFCLIYGANLAYRAQNRELLMAGPAAMIMHLGWSVGFWRTMAGNLWRRE